MLTASNRVEKRRFMLRLPQLVLTSLGLLFFAGTDYPAETTMPAPRPETYRRLAR